jgi:hypothetical protein
MERKFYIALEILLFVILAAVLMYAASTSGI